MEPNLTAAQIVLLIYGIFIMVGGIIGYLKVQSKASLIAGVTSGTLILGCFALSFYSEVVGYALGAAVAAVLTMQFALRTQASKKVMPAGGLMMVSLGVLIAEAVWASKVGK